MSRLAEGAGIGHGLLKGVGRLAPPAPGVFREGEACAAPASPARAVLGFRARSGPEAPIFVGQTPTKFATERKIKPRGAARPDPLMQKPGGDHREVGERPSRQRYLKLIRKRTDVSPTSYD
jgi:hypothetical protein